MLTEGWIPRTVSKPHDYQYQYRVDHRPGELAWSPGTIRDLFADEQLMRVQYYMTAVRANDELHALSSDIASLDAHEVKKYAQGVFNTVRLIPKVFQKTKRSTKTKSVDINICVDVMDYVSRNAVDSVYFVTGDVDYLPLIDAVMRAGKRVYVAALSSGLAPRLRTGTDRFVDLNDTYFSGRNFAAPEG